MIIQARENETYNEYIERILSSRPNKKINKTQQKHHIIPKSRGGSDDEKNLIWLFKSEHAKAHFLYSKEHPHDSGMAYAAHALSHKDGKLLTDEEIEEIAKRNSELQSARVSGNKNPMWSKHHTEESRKKNSESNKGKSAGEKNPMYGVHMCGPDSPRYGKPASEQQKRKQSESMMGKYKGELNPRSIKIKCVDTDEVFPTLKDAANWCGLKHPSDITNHIKGNKKSAGKHPETKLKLHWAYVE